MPIYAYRCRRCGTEFEKLVLSAAGADRAICPSCQSEEVERQLTLFGLGSRPGTLSTESRCAPSSGGG